MSLVSGLLPALDSIRAIPDILGLRPFSIIMRVVTWSGERIGQGNATYTDTPITVGGGHAPRIRHITCKEVIASGGRYSDQDWLIGNLTPSYTSGGTDPASFDPPQLDGYMQEVYFRITGPDIPASSAWFKKVSDEVNSALHYSFVVRKVAAIPSWT